MADWFLLVIGVHYVFLAFAVLACVSEGAGDRVLRNWLRVIREPYTHGDYGFIWVYFTSMYCMFWGALMIVATRWDKGAKQDLTGISIAIAVLGLLLAIAGFRSPQFNQRGLYVVYVLWAAQIIWGVWFYLALE